MDDTTTTTDPAEIARGLSPAQRRVVLACVAHEREEARLVAKYPRKTARPWFAYGPDKIPARRAIDARLLWPGRRGWAGDVESTPLGRAVAAVLAAADPTE